MRDSHQTGGGCVQHGDLDARSDARRESTVTERFKALAQEMETAKVRLKDVDQQERQPHRSQQQQPMQGRKVEKGKEKQEEKGKEMGMESKKEKEGTRRKYKTGRNEGKEEVSRKWLRTT